jgi:hypothetical protein
VSLSCNGGMLTYIQECGAFSRLEDYLIGMRYGKFCIMLFIHAEGSIKGTTRFARESEVPTITWVICHPCTSCQMQGQHGSTVRRQHYGSQGKNTAVHCLTKSAQISWSSATCNAGLELSRQAESVSVLADHSTQSGSDWMSVYSPHPPSCQAAVDLK